ncbi:MAG: response regulator [Anaerolineae bacterium CFX3]|jgi:DNA-binding NtrC family response regulator|nr:response regulator [Anaerolineae bacterium CFX3]MCQ3946106.1 hypothetical protein [Anaerolineae bacterium]RIK27527.1 MAG: hypothetical protein DCC54_02635 [Anaerolineae bacterium]
MRNRNLSKKYSVLVVDDQDNWRELLIDLLKDDFEVKSASNFNEALEIIRNQDPPFHVVVTDMRLNDEETGNEDGLTLIEKLNERGDETKTIVVTGYATIDTARRALSNLAAYDYLEKRPSDGKPFDIEGIRSVVHRAAEEVEIKRSEGFTDISYNVLVLEPDRVQRLKLEEILQKDGYQVTILEDVEGLERLPADTAASCILILVNESLTSDSLFNRLQRLCPKGSIVVLTLSGIDKIVEAMREYPVLTALPMPTDKSNDKKLRDILHSALPRKYISVQIKDPSQQEPVVTKGKIGQTYQMVFSIQDTPSEDNAIGVVLMPRGGMKRKTALRLSVHAKEMKIEPETERDWDIPLSIERPGPCYFLITPESAGTHNITIEIDQENRWLGRISMKVDVESQILGENQWAIKNTLF